MPLFPVVDFAGTYDVDEQQTLFDVFDADRRSPDHGRRADRGTAVAYADYAAADEGQKSSSRSSTSGARRRRSTKYSGSSTIPSWTRLRADSRRPICQRINSADADGDGKFDPIGYEVNTGGTPVYLDMNSPLIRAQGFLELNLFDTIFLTGSVAFELGPTQRR